MRLLICCGLFVLALWACESNSAGTSEIREEYPASFQISLNNNADQGHTSVVLLDIASIEVKHDDFNVDAFVAFQGATELPSQAIDTDGDKSADQIGVHLETPASEKLQLTIFYAKTGSKSRSYPQLTQAEISRKEGGYFEDRVYIGGNFQNVQALRVPPEHTDHSYYIRYEGPGWESDKIGYRFYLDWRNATDIFGKRTPEMVLQKVGQDGFDSYHEMADWGMDILKVGSSLGIGSIAMWHEGKAERVAVTDSIYCEIFANGPVYSQIRTVYSGWEIAGGKHDLISDLSITAGSRLTRHSLQVSDNPENLCTGIVKHPGTTLLKKSGTEKTWGYLATYGQQSLSEDKLGMAVLFRPENFISFAEDEHSEVVVLKPEEGKLEYYFLAAWEQEPGGIQSESEFMTYIDELTVSLGEAITVDY